MQNETNRITSYLFLEDEVVWNVETVDQKMVMLLSLGFVFGVGEGHHLYHGTPSVFVLNLKGW